ncbi:YciI-like protein [Roseibium aestuarii]|uniref:YciI-like protein n=1 Tax=Roseibium aestuarii TaxID=2600299 RepID=A0ABW4JW80_9HYPH|nr:YciI-like protein [Roseibium aestuarii]
MLFALICTDKPGALQVRLDNRPAHIEFLKGLGDKLKAAGPFLDAEGNMSGSLVVIEADDRSAIEAIAAQDPYAVAGLFASVDIRPWNWAVKNPEAN